MLKPTHHHDGQRGSAFEVAADDRGAPVTYLDSQAVLVATLGSV